MSARFQNLTDWLQWLETLHPVEIDLGLERTQEVARKLELLKPSAKVITVAGTNGKGSFVETLKSLLLVQGQTVGAYTSPHLLNYNERIAVNENYACSEDICRAFAAVDAARGEISLTYFEFGTLAALYLFKSYKLDYWILEVGLGGRLDAVNILDADIAVITSIALDHESWLGNTREKIALEKAGITRENGTLVLAEEDEPASLTDLIREKKIKCLRLGKDFNLLRENGIFSFSCCEQQRRHFSPESKPELPLASMASAMAVAELLQVLPAESELATLFSRLGLNGRFQKLKYKNKNLVLDVAHNPAASAYFARRLQSHEIGQARAIVAIMADKNIEQVLQALLPVVAHWCCCGLPTNPRAAKAESLQKTLQALGVPSTAISLYATPNDALMAATQYNQQNIVVFGSFYTVESILKMIGVRQRG